MVNPKEIERLAIDGGPKVRTRPMPPEYPGALVIGEEEKRAAMEVLESQSLFRYYGPKLLRKVDRFEKDFATAQGTKFALGVNSGTSALMCALAALGVGPGDEVLVPAYTWVATMLSVIAVHAVPVLVEIDDSLSMDPVDAEKRITPRTKAMLPVHMGGVPARIDQLVQVAKRHGIGLVEDCAQANGASFQGKRLGAWGDLGAFSLQLHKVITAGEGGAVTTDDPKLHERAVRYHDIGMLRSPDRSVYENESDSWGFGMNLKLSEIQGAILVEQLVKREGLLQKMRANNAALRERISGISGLGFRAVPDLDGQVGCTLTLMLPSKATAARFQKALDAEGVGCEHLCDVGGDNYTNWKFLMEDQRAHAIQAPWECGCYPGGKPKITAGMYPRTDEILSRGVQMHVSPVLDARDVDEIAAAIRKVARVVLAETT